MDGQRLHPDLRGAAPDRRRARRPLRPPAHVRDRHRHLHAGLGAGGARADGHRARPRTRPAGRGRCDRHAAHPDHPQRGGAGRQARPRARRLGRHRRPGRRARPGRRRSRRPGHLLALDLLAQRADRPRPDPARLVAPERELRPEGAHGPARSRPRERRPARHRVGPRARQRAGLDESRDRRLAGRAAPCWWPRSRSGSCARASRCCRCASSRTAPSRSPTSRRCSCSSGCSARSSCSRSSSRPCRATRRSTRAAHPALDGDADLRRPARRRVLRPHRRTAPDGRRAGAAGDRAGVDRLRLVGHRGLRRALRARS